MSFSLFNLQREHYEVKATDRTCWISQLQTNISCIAPKFELYCNSYLEFNWTGIDFDHPATITKVNTKNIPIQIKCKYPNYEDEFIISSWAGIDDVPEDAFISLPYKVWQNNAYQTIYFHNSILVDQLNKKVFLKKRIQKIELTGDEPNWFFHEWSNSYIVSFPQIEGAGRCAMCSHLTYNDWNASMTLTEYGMNNYYEPMFYNAATQYSSLDSFKAKLRSLHAAGIPVTIWFISDWSMTVEELENSFELIDITESNPKFSNFLLTGGSLGRPLRQLANENYEVINAGTIDTNDYFTFTRLDYLVSR